MAVTSLAVTGASIKRLTLTAARRQQLLEHGGAGEAKSVQRGGGRSEAARRTAEREREREEKYLLAGMGIRAGSSGK